MSRDWLAAYTGILGKPKYRRLTIFGRAALFHVWLLAGGQTPEATWSSRADLADLLDLDGYPPDCIQELIDRQWLDVDPDGRVLVHDWDDWQLAATRAARTAYERDRKQEWRRRHKEEIVAPLPPRPLSPDITVTQQVHDTTTQESQSVRDTSGTRKGRGTTPVQPLKRTNGRTSDTCPACGDLVKAGEPNVATDRHGQPWHRACPSSIGVSA